MERPQRLLGDRLARLKRSFSPKVLHAKGLAD